jgi:hypothetical protein
MGLAKALWDRDNDLACLAALREIQVFKSGDNYSGINEELLRYLVNGR